MYDDILGKASDIREIKNRKFNIENQKKEEELDQLDLFEDLILEMEDME
jgi:hypothetical protein